MCVDRGGLQADTTSVLKSQTHVFVVVVVSLASLFLSTSPQCVRRKWNWSQIIPPLKESFQPGVFLQELIYNVPLKHKHAAVWKHSLALVKMKTERSACQDLWHQRKWRAVISAACSRITPLPGSAGERPPNPIQHQMNWSILYNNLFHYLNERGGYIFFWLMVQAAINGEPLKSCAKD